MTTFNNDQYLKYIQPQNELCHFINNEFTYNIDDPSATFDVIQPNNGTVLCKVASGTSKEVDLAVEAAVNAAKPNSEWRRMSIHKRRALLLKLVSKWQEEAEDLAVLESLNNGSPVTLQKIIVEDLVNDWLYHIGWMDKIAGRVCSDPNSNDDRHVYVRREPIGACGLVLPWNVPLWCLIVKLAPALSCGNTIVVKPSEFTPLTCLKVAKMIKECGFPPGVFNVVNGFGLEVGEPLARHPKLRKIAFTGSTRTGRAIAKCAAESNLKQVQLELGGKSPVIVMPDVNIPEAVRICNHAVFNNNGQLCTAGSRTYVHEQIYDEFVKEAVKQAQQIKVGNQMDAETRCGPLVNKLQFEKVLDFIKHGMKDGTLQCGGPEPAFPEGYFVRPTIFTDLAHDSKLACEEIFGPVMSIFKFKDVEEVIEFANSSEYGLASGIITKDSRVAMDIGHRLETNTVWINHYHGAMVTAEFGGYKSSGFGREGGEEGVLAWTQSKSIFIHKGNRDI